MDSYTQMMLMLLPKMQSWLLKIKTENNKTARLRSPALCGRTGSGLIAAAFVSVFYQKQTQKSHVI